MSSDLAIDLRGVGKAYPMYRRPEDRLKQMLLGWRRRYYEEHWALRDVDLQVRRGETVGIIGRNGSGKSTLLQLVCGTLLPTTGTVATNGRIAPLLELGAGFHPEFTGRENIHVAAAVHGLSEQAVADRLPDIEAFAGIGAFIDQPVKTYSSGMYARLAFALAAHVDADILVIDEILAVGDAAFNQKCMRFIRRFKERGTIFFVSHDSATVRNLCDRAVWLQRGAMRASGPAGLVCDEYAASLYQEMDGDGAFASGGSRRSAEPRPPADPRFARLAAEGLPNAIKVFAFDPDASWFGHRGASIDRVTLTAVAADGSLRTAVDLHGGDEVVITLSGVATSRLEQPIVGFTVKDRLGQALFGDNTFLSHRDAPVPLAPGESFEARFRFVMPYLPTGVFVVCAAIADGNQDEHVQHHWIDEALTFEVVSSHVAKGLVGVPMIEVVLAKAMATRADG